MMKTYFSVAAALLLFSSAVFAGQDPNLSVTFTSNNGGGNSQCQQVSQSDLFSSAAAAVPFSAVIANTNSQAAVVIKAVTFDTNSASAGTTGQDDITVTDPALLASCNGKVLMPKGQAGDTCSIPLTYLPPVLYTPAVTGDKFTVSAISTLPLPNLQPVSGVLNLNMGGPGTGSDLVVAIYTVGADQTFYRTPKAAPGSLMNRIGNGVDYNYILYTGVPTVSAKLIYSVTNVSSVPKTIAIRCKYSGINDDPPPATTVTTSSATGQCDNTTLAPGATCYGLISAMPQVPTHPSTWTALLSTFSVYDTQAGFVSPSDRFFYRGDFNGNPATS